MIRVFVYGSLKRGFSNHRLLEGSKFLGEAVSLDRFAMWGDAFPLLVPADDGLQVRGELWGVGISTLASLDRLEGHPRLYCRERRGFGSSRAAALGAFRVVEAWVYLARCEWGGRRDEGRVSKAGGVLEWTL